MKRLALAVWTGALACASAPLPADVDALRRSALVAGDRAALEALLDDALRYGHASGQLQSKRELMAALTSGAIDYRRIDAAIATSQRHGDTLVITGTQELEVETSQRVLSMRGVFTAVYRERDGAWRLIAYQSAPLPTSAAPTR